MNTFNRALFVLVGVALVATGAVGFATGAGLLDVNPVDYARDVVFGVEWSDQQVRLVAVFAGCVVALVGLALVVREVLPPRRVEPMVEVSVLAKGRTRVSTTALQHVYEGAASTVEGVSRAQVSSLAISPDVVRVNVDARLDGGFSASEAGAELIARSAEAVQRTLPGREIRVRAVIEQSHGRRARKRLRRAK